MMALAAWPVHAQEGELSAEEMELLEFVAASFDNFLAQESYRGHVIMDMTMAIDAVQGGDTLEMDMSISMDVSSQIALKDGEIAASTEQGTIDIEIGMTGQSISGSMTMASVQLEDDVWVRVEDATGFATGLYPDNWVNVAENPEAFEGAEMFNWENLADTGVEQLKASIDDEAVLSIEELEPETLDGQEMRVFEINTDPAMATGSISDMFDPAAMGLDPAAMVEAMFEDATLVWRVWINVEDGLPYRFVRDLAVNADFSDLVGFAMIMGVEGSGDVSFFDFNEPAEIEPPDMDAGQ
jgi:hypothetical protein